MNNIFENMSKKEKKEFEKLSNEEKAKVLEIAITQKVSSVMEKEIPKAIISGMKIALDQIYEKYIFQYDKTEDKDHKEKIKEELFSYIRSEHLKHISEGGKKL